ncbi:disease resistance protein At4g27190 [Ziziphus jujuba]|uniref:Disease resistance protein At4g27190 n=1 Tax=Ziziphus jujuba TaxID=326968 RepID=A0A6P6FW73_ZIZJJ|nr:disease resistance protein At4g27190 [Ziziphus jujuba]
MEGAVGAIVELLKLIAAPLGKCVKDHRGVKEYVKTLDENLERLNCRKEDVEAKKRAELVPKTKLKKEVELWLAKTQKINEEITIIKQKVEKGNYLCRARLGSTVLEKIQEVEAHYQRGVFLDGVVEVDTQPGDILPTTALVEKTSERKLEEIWTSLLDDEVRKIGVYGMGGIGKTTIVKHINNRILEKKDNFENVIWVTVSKASDVIKLQDAIACKLDLDISKYDDETTRASKIYTSLSEKKRYVLILDDLWEVYRLEDVGIPEPTSTNGCKLVLTTRSLNVCRGMNCKSIRMELLTEEEAKMLFMDRVGHDVLGTPEVEPIVNEIVEECGRLPLAIITIAGGLKGVTDYREWRTALQELKSSMKGPNDSGNRILEQLQFSYNRLNDKKLQDCLLYCALYPEDYEIPRDELIQHLIDERIIEGMKTRQVEFEKGHSMLNKLENVCLLEGWLSEYKRTYLVKMHDLIRSMALQIASVNPGYLIEAGAGLEEIPDEENWAEDLARVSLMSNKISCISSGVSPRCPRLSTLWLNNNILLTSIPDCFFVHMNALSVLNLSYTDIEYLPESISELVNLTALLLKKCWRLNKLPSLANLKALRRLDFCDTKISQVPQGTEMLVNLRYLNLSTKYLEIIPGSILPKLSLQFLELQAKVKVEELATLRKLETLNWILYDINLFNSYVKLLGKRRPSNYVLMVGFNIIYDEFQYNKIVFLKNCNVNESIPEEYRLLLPEDVEFLRFEECHDVKSLCEVSSLKNAIGLKACSIFNCAGIEHVLTSSCTDPLLQRLESICLFYLKNLCGLVLKERGASFLRPPQTFSSLREISVTYCPNIKKLFTLSLLVYLQNLEKLYVSRCEQMVEIIAPDEDEEEDQIQGESGGSSKFYLPKLKILKLWLLPELEILYNSRKALVVDSLQEIYIFQCLNVRRIPFLDVELHPRSLEKIYVKKEWWESLEWDHLEARNYLQPFCIWIS